MTIKVKVDFSGVHEKFSTANIQRGKRAMANQMLSDMNLNVPRREGDLRNMSTIDMDGSGITWHSVYAHRMFTGSKRWHYTTSGTGPRWDQVAKGVHGKQWVEVFKRGAKF